MKNLGQMMKQAQELQAKMGEMQAKLETLDIEGASAGGMVTVRLNGKGEMRGLKVDPTLIDPAQAGILEDLVVAAHNDAKSKLDRRMADEMSSLTGGMTLPEDPRGEGESIQLTRSYSHSMLAGRRAGVPIPQPSSSKLH